MIRSNRKARHYYCTPEQNAHCRMGLRAVSVAEITATPWIGGKGERSEPRPPWAISHEPLWLLVLGLAQVVELVHGEVPTVSCGASVPVVAHDVLSVATDQPHPMGVSSRPGEVEPSLVQVVKQVLHRISRLLVLLSVKDFQELEALGSKVCEQVGHDGAFDEGGSVHAGILTDPGWVVKPHTAEINIFIPGILGVDRFGILWYNRGGSRPGILSTSESDNKKGFLTRSRTQ